MAKKNKEKLVCAECGGANITYTAMAIFDANTRKFLCDLDSLLEINDNKDYFCNDCGEYVEVVTESEYLNTK